MRAHAAESAPGRWEGVERRPYKEEGTHFRDVSRQLLLGEESGLPCDLRYFEVGPEGHTTLERHAHPHGVLVLRGRGRALVGEEILDLRAHDLVRVPPWTWHQFRASEEATLGFLCLVPRERDRPQRPGPGFFAGGRKSLTVTDPRVRPSLRARSRRRRQTGCFFSSKLPLRDSSVWTIWPTSSQGI